MSQTLTHTIFKFTAFVENGVVVYLVEVGNPRLPDTQDGTVEIHYTERQRWDAEQFKMQIDGRDGNLNVQFIPHEEKKDEGLIVLPGARYKKGGFDGDLT